MKGAAGVGKSAVAQTSAEKIKSSGMLGAAYFFSTHGRSKHNTLFPSIAYQLSVGFAGYGEILNSKILLDQTLVDKTLNSQFRDLIVDPLVELERERNGIGKRITVIIDGLDECEGVDAQCSIIEIIAASARERTIPSCWAFLSRPEPHIEAMFSQRDIAELCHMTILPVSHDADDDIKLYLRSSFNDILQRRNIAMDHPWPSNNDMKTIVAASKGLFIYAATLYRFVAQPDWISPDEPLDAVLAVISEVQKKTLSGSSPFAELDAFYLLIMRRIPDRMMPSVRLLLGYLCLPGSELGMIHIANVSGCPKYEFRRSVPTRVLCFGFMRTTNPFLDRRWDVNQPFHMISHTESHPIVYEMLEHVPQLGRKIFFYHKSFADFLVDPNRPGPFCVRTSACYEHQFENFLKVRLDHEESYCLSGSS